MNDETPSSDMTVEPNYDPQTAPANGLEFSQEELDLGGAGQKLRAERERQKLTLAMVAAETRIPERHLLSIESGDFDGLPARTYAIGFSRSYARMLGMDERAVASQVREEMAEHGPQERNRTASFEPGDPARVPSRGLAWFGFLAVVLLIAGCFAFYRSYFAPGSGPASAIAMQEANDAAAQRNAATPKETAPAIKPDGQVVFTSLEDGTWVRFYDESDEVLMEGTMAKGATFAVPRDAAGPQIRTGRPDAFSVAIGGKSVPKLAEELFVMKDVPVDAASLLARDEEVVIATPAI